MNIKVKIEHLATKADVKKVKADMIKWMFIFSASQILAILGIVYLKG